MTNIIESEERNRVAHNDMFELGSMLRRKRKDRGYLLRDIASAIGRSPQFVCDVEKGRRGQKMEPVVVMLWCEYLSIDPHDVFAYLGMGESDVERFRVQEYLKTSLWAHKFLGGRTLVIEALEEVDSLLPRLKRGSIEKDQGYRIRTLLREAKESLHIPQPSTGAPNAA